MASFTKLLLYSQLHGTESLRAISDCVFSEELQEASNLKSISFSQLRIRLHQVATEFFQEIFLDFLALIVYCLNALAQLATKSKRTYLEISRYLKAALWKPAHLWIRKIQGKNVP